MAIAWMKIASLAEAKIHTLHGGIVRSAAETPDSGHSSREIEIITASVVLDTATVRVEQSSRQGDHYIIETNHGAMFSLLATPGTKVQTGQVVAELISEEYRTNTGGLIKYSGIETAKKGKGKQGYEVVKGGQFSGFLKKLTKLIKTSLYC
jgi:DNA-directed RNA polymerase subunit beta'